ncbi:MAG: methyltransferase domain-containing protein [Thermodesulfobacteriota bacterium]
MGGQIALHRSPPRACVGKWPILTRPAAAVTLACRKDTMVQQAAPDLDIRLGDVRGIDLPSDSLAGYWSLGVIEHFWEGYEAIGREGARVLRPGGHLFLAFPFMNGHRQQRLAPRLPVWQAAEPPPGFYQFALAVEGVVRDFEGWGFQLLARSCSGVLFGWQDDVPALQSPVRWWLKHRHGSRLGRILHAGVTAGLDRLLGFWYGHTVLLVFRKLGCRPG